MDNKAIVNDAPFPACFTPELLCIVKGEGSWLEDRAGKRYLDFAGGIAVNALGYGREDVARRAYEQMLKLTHISNLFITEPALELSRKMVARDGFEAVQFLNSGSEANETALKYARLYALRKKGENCHKLLCFTGGFHGRTMGALSVTATAKYQEPFMPLVPGVEVAEYNDPTGLDRLDSSFAAVIVEVIQGEGGLNCMSEAFARVLNERCAQADALLIADEVQTGLSRTGTFYASEGVGLKPDLITLAKPLAGGLPLSAVLIPKKVNELIHLGEHGTTFGGGPVTTAVGSLIWDALSDAAFIEEIQIKGQYLRAGLEQLRSSFKFLGEIKGKALLTGIELLEEKTGIDDALAQCMTAMRDNGLLVLRSGANVLRIAPPLIITKKEIDQGIGIMEMVFRSIA